MDEDTPHCRPDPALIPDIARLTRAGRDERPGDQRGCDRRAFQVLRDGYNLVSAQLFYLGSFRLHLLLCRRAPWVFPPFAYNWRPGRISRSLLPVFAVPLLVFAAPLLRSSDIRRPLSKRWLTPDSPTTAQKHSSECRKNTGSRFSNGPSKI